MDLLDDFFLLLFFLDVVDDDPFFFFKPKCFAIPFACPSALLFNSEFVLILLLPLLVSINSFSVIIAGFLVCGTTAKYAFFRPRLRSPVAFISSLLIDRCTRPAF